MEKKKKHRKDCGRKTLRAVRENEVIHILYALILLTTENYPFSLLERKQEVSIYEIYL